MALESKVLVVDDDEDIRQSIQWMLEGAGITSSAYGSAEELLKDYNPEQPCCLLLDLRLPGKTGLELYDELAQRSKDGYCPPFIVITGHGDVPIAVDAMRRGAVDFIEKPFQRQTLIDSVKKAMQLDRDSRDVHRNSEDIRKRIDSLTARERQIMNLVVDGRLTKEIASDLGISQKTVEVHRANLMRKMRAASLADLVRVVTAQRYGGKKEESTPAS